MAFPGMASNGHRRLQYKERLSRTCLDFYPSSFSDIAKAWSFDFSRTAIQRCTAHAVRTARQILAFLNHPHPSAGYIFTLLQAGEDLSQATHQLSYLESHDYLSSTTPSATCVPRSSSSLALILSSSSGVLVRNCNAWIPPSRAISSFSNA